ncbi:hypothetical protein Tco_0014499, partial [Tanacetum coccineum]
EEARIQLQAEEFDLMAAAGDLDEIKEVNANYILMANLQSLYVYAWWWMEMARSSKLALVDHHKSSSGAIEEEHRQPKARAPA